MLLMKMFRCDNMMLAYIKFRLIQNQAKRLAQTNYQVYKVKSFYQQVQLANLFKFILVIKFLFTSNCI